MRRILDVVRRGTDVVDVLFLALVSVTLELPIIVLHAVDLYHYLFEDRRCSMCDPMSTIAAANSAADFSMRFLVVLR